MTLTPVKRFWKVLKPYRSQIRQIYTFALFIGIVNLTLPLGIQAIINFLQAGEYTTTWIILVTFVLIGIALSGFLQVLQLRIVENIQQDLFAKSAFEFAYRLPKISNLKLDKIHLPELVNRFFDTITIQKGLPKILIDFSLSIFQIIFGLALLTIYSPYFIILGVILTVTLWVTFKITGPKGLKTSLTESSNKYKLAHWLEEIARVNGSFKVFANHNLHLNKTDTIAEEYIISRESHFQVLLNQFRLFIGFKVIVAAGLLVLGGYLVFQEQMNLGQFVAAEIIVILIINSVEKILRITDTIYDVLTSIDKIGFVADLDLDEVGGVAQVHSEQGLHIEVQEMSFGFPDSNKSIFNNLSFTIDSNEKRVLKGNSGSGKTLLLRILSGTLPLDNGEIYLNNTPISSYSKDEIYKSIGVSFPTNQIFDGTIYENILLGRNISEDVVTDMIRNLNFKQYVIQQPYGIHTQIDSGGRRLPRSIIQKILIARLLIGSPKLLLMEDPLQFINDIDKKKIIDYIVDDERNWTVLVISDYYYWEEKCSSTLDLNLLKKA